MNLALSLSPGVYVLAVSGGVDSMALLDVAAKQYGHADSDVRLIVAHFDHGIRADSGEDRQLVQRAAKQYGLQFVYDNGHLGAGASEEVARNARYEFLRRVQEVSGADALVTAHHQDDVIETAMLNMLRGTGRRGLTSLISSVHVVRPFLDVEKSVLVAYAQKHQLSWHEDSTNASTDYLRNRIRHEMLPRLTDAERRELVRVLDSLRATNVMLDAELERFVRLHSHNGMLARRAFCMLPHGIAKEVVATWLRSHGILGYNRQLLERLVIAAKTYRPGKSASVQNGHLLVVEKAFLALRRVDR